MEKIKCTIETNSLENMTPLEDRNQKLAEQMIKNLNRRKMEAFYCPID